MALEPLEALVADVTRRLASGATLVLEDERLRRATGALARLARQVPALAPVVSAAEYLVAANAEQAPAALLDLLVCTHRARVSLAPAGVTGSLAALPPSGPWASAAPPQDLAPVLDLLRLPSGQKRRRGLQVFLEQGLPADLRLVGPLLDHLADRDVVVAGLVTRRGLPVFGALLVPELRQRFRLDGDDADGRRLRALCQLAPEHEAERCLGAARQGSKAVRQVALACLPALCPPTVTVPILIEALRDSGVATVAAEGLRQVGAAVVPALAALLQDPSTLVRRRAAEVLRLLGPAAQDALPALQAALGDRAASVRTEALYALGTFGPRAREAVPALFSLLRHDRDDGVRALALLTLVDVAPDDPQLVPVILSAVEQDRGPGVRVTALHALGRLRADIATVLPVHVAAVRDECLGLRRSAVRALRSIGPQARDAAPALCAALQDADSEVQELARRALKAIGRPGFEAVARAAADDSRPEAERTERVRDLWRMRPDARGAVPAVVEPLRRALHAADPQRNTAAFWALAHLAASLRQRAGGRAPRPSECPADVAELSQVVTAEIVPRLCRAVAGDDNNRRDEAVPLLLDLDPSGRTLLDALRAALRSPNTPIRRGAIYRFAELRDRALPAVSDLLDLLRDRDGWMRRHAVEALAWCGADARVVPALLPLLESESMTRVGDTTYPAAHVSRALGRIGPAARQAAPLLAWALTVEGLADFDVPVALAGITGEASAAVAYLERLLRMSHYEFPIKAARALGEIGPAARSAAPALAEALRSESWQVRQWAAVALLQIGAEVQPAITILTAELRREFWRTDSAQLRHVFKAFREGPDCGAALTAALAAPEENARYLAAILLAELAPTTSEIVGVLAEAVNREPDDLAVELRVRAVEALGSLGPLAHSALPALRTSLGRLRHWGLRGAVHQTLTRIAGEP